MTEPSIIKKPSRGGGAVVESAVINRGCQSVFDRFGQPAFHGEWNPRNIFNVLTTSPSMWEGKRVLDIGANTLGLSVEIARAGGIVTGAEPDPYNNTYAKSRDAVKQIILDEGLQLQHVNANLFETHCLGTFDIVLCLGLVYHFRDQQFCLDYLSTLQHDLLFISTQTAAGASLQMVNRRDESVLRSGHLSEKIVLSGWHPTRPLFERMLQWAGYTNVRSLTDNSYNFPNKQRGLTNTAYYRAEPTITVDPIKSRYEFYPR